MSIGTYTELVTAVSTYLHTASYDTLVPTFITMGESRLNDQLSLTAMQAFTTLTASTSDRFVALPPRYNGPISLYLLVSNIRVELSALPPQAMAKRVNITSSTQPRYYSIGSQIEFDCTPDSAYSLTFNYFKKLDIASDTTNFLLTSNPRAYLYAALCEAYSYREDDAKVTKYEALLQAEIDRLTDSDNTNRSNSLTVVDAALMGAPRSNIFIG